MMRYYSREIIALSLLALAGCSLTPDYRRPQADAPESWRNQKIKLDVTTAAISEHWWKQFGSTELDRLMTEAMQNNNDLAIALQRIEQARALAKIAGAPLWPAIGVNGNIVTSSDSVDGNRIDSTAWDARWNMAYEVDLWGALRAGRDAALARMETSQFTREALRLTVMGDVAQTYFSVLGLQDRTRIAADNLKNIGEVLDIITARFEAGSASALDVAQQQTELANARAALALLQQQEAQTENALAVLLGRPPQQLRIAAQSLQAIRIPQPQPLKPVELFDRRPDIRSVEADLIAANADIGIARAAFMPRLQLNGDGIVAAASMSHPAGFAWALASTLSSPIFQGGQLEGELERTQARRAELTESYRKIVLNAFQEVEDALVLRRQSAQRRDALEFSVTSAQQAYDLARERYLAGAIDYQTLLNVQRSLFAAQDNKIQAQNDVLASAALLFKALGGGWKDTPSD